MLLGTIRRCFVGIVCLACCLISNKAAAQADLPASAISHYIMAVLYEQDGDIDRAIEEYQKVLRSDQKSLLIHLRLAASYIKAGNSTKAVLELKRAAKFEPEAVEPHVILALLYTSENKPELAGSEYELALKNAVKLEPRNIDIYKSLGMVYLRQKRFQDAKGVYSLIIEIAPEDAGAHFYLGGVYGILNSHALEEQEIKRSLELQPEYPEALNYLAFLYADQNKNLDQAEAMIKKALEFDPENGAYLDTLGWVYFRKSRFIQARDILEKAAQLLEDPVIFDHLAQVYLKLGQSEKASDFRSKALKLDPEQNKISKDLPVIIK